MYLATTFVSHFLQLPQCKYVIMKRASKLQTKLSESYSDLYYSKKSVCIKT